MIARECSSIVGTEIEWGDSGVPFLQVASVSFQHFRGLAAHLRTASESLQNPRLVNDVQHVLSNDLSGVRRRNRKATHAGC